MGVRLDISSGLYVIDRDVKEDNQWSVVLRAVGGFVRSAAHYKAQSVFYVGADIEMLWRAIYI